MQDGAFIIGQDIPRIDGEEKIRGEAEFIDDLSMPGQLTGAVAVSPVAHATIVSIDTSKAQALPGVEAVLTAADMPEVLTGAFIKDEQIFARDRVRYIGEAVAAVAAIDQGTAERAAQLIDVVYDELPTVLNMDEALGPDAPVIHPDFGSYSKSVPTGFDGNRFWRSDIEEGDVDGAWADCEVVVEDVFETQAQHHLYMEPCGALAEPARDGRVSVWSSCQSVHLTQQRIAEAVGLPMAMVRALVPKVGGGFGGKGSPGVQPIAAALALATHKPVRIILSRTEDFEQMRSRHPARIKMKTGALKDGTLIAREFSAVMDCGAYADDSPAVVSICALFGRGPYRIANLRGRADGVYTNKLKAGAFRGFGNPQITFASESQIDDIARQLDMDPFEIRLKNAMRPGDRFAGGQVVESCAFVECLEQLKAAVDNALPAIKPASGRRVGIGYAGLSHVSGLLSTAATLELRVDGSVSLGCGVVDIGQGSDTVLRQICAEALMLPVDRVALGQPDSDVSPYDWKTAASRVTYMAGRAILGATDQVREQILTAAGDMMECASEDLEFRPGGLVGLKGVPAKVISFGDVARRALYAVGGPIHGRAGLLFDGAPMDPKHAVVDGFAFSNVGIYTFGAQAVEVEVDEVTGATRVLRAWSAHDVGRSINPSMVAGQIQGGFVQGMGYALTEEMVWDGGRLVNPTMMDYKAPGFLDSPPEIHPIIIEDPEPTGPFGAKGVGEPPLVGAAPAIRNAIANAVGVSVNQLPMTPERVFNATVKKH